MQTLKAYAKHISALAVILLWTLFLNITGPACPPEIAYPLFGVCLLSSLCWLESYASDKFVGIFGETLDNNDNM